MKTKVYIIQFLIAKNLKFYSFYICDNDHIKDTPIMHKERIIIFATLQSAYSFLKKHKSIYVRGNNGIMKYDIALARTNIMSKKQPQGTVVDLLNCYFDYLQSIGIEKFCILTKQQANKLADEATFNHDLSKYFIDNPTVTPEMVVNFIDWATGVIMNNSYLYKL